MINVSQNLIVGVSVDGGHHARLDAQLVVQRLGDRSQTVGGARRVGDNGHFGSQDVFVYAVNDSAVNVFVARSGDDNFLGACIQVSLALSLGTEDTGALEHHVYLQLAPWQFGWVTLGQHLDFVTIYEHGVFALLNLSVETTVNGVKFGQVSIDLGVAQVVDSNDLELVSTAAFIQGTQYVAADTSITVNSNTDHFRALTIQLVNFRNTASCSLPVQIYTQ